MSLVLAVDDDGEEKLHPRRLFYHLRHRSRLRDHDNVCDHGRLTESRVYRISVLSTNRQTEVLIKLFSPPTDKMKSGLLIMALMQTCLPPKISGRNQMTKK